MPKAKPSGDGLTAETITYRSGHVMYAIVDYRIEGKPADRRIFESSREDTRDYVLARMREREAGKVEKLVELVLDN
jgi:hypothetical protein